MKKDYSELRDSPAQRGLDLAFEHVQWLLTLIEPLLTTYMQHGYKHGYADGRADEALAEMKDGKE